MPRCLSLAMPLSSLTDPKSHQMPPSFGSCASSRTSSSPITALEECLPVSTLWKSLRPLLMSRPSGDHHHFLLTVSAVIAAAIQGGFKDKVEFMRYDVPAAFLQRLLPTPFYGRLPPDLPEPYGNSFVKVLRCIYDARISNKIFDEDHTQLQHLCHPQHLCG